MRLDKRVSEQFSSRNKAAEAIKDGKVFVNGQKIVKPSFEVEENDVIEIREPDLFVSRSGNKLQAAFDHFGFDITDEIVADIGASTGGFTQCSLNHGAKKVYAIDVGVLQLNEALKKDPRVVSMENHNARDISPAWFDEPIDFICMDVSFISSLKILEPAILRLNPRHLMILIKPQFELSKNALTKRGIVKNEKYRAEAITRVKSFMEKYYRNVKVIDCPLPGKEGNQEALLYASERRSDDRTVIG